jgi:hypothetical protein
VHHTGHAASHLAVQRCRSSEQRNWAGAAFCSVCAPRPPTAANGCECWQVHGDPGAISGAEGQLVLPRVRDGDHALLRVRRLRRGPRGPLRAQVQPRGVRPLLPPQVSRSSRAEGAAPRCVAEAAMLHGSVAVCCTAHRMVMLQLGSAMHRGINRRPWRARTAPSAA